MAKIKKIGVLTSGGDAPGMNAAMEALPDDQKSVMVGIQNGEIVLIPFRKAVKLHKDVNHALITLAHVLSV